MMRFSESLSNLGKALAAAQGKLGSAAKSSVNPHFKSKYADLSEVINTVRPIFSTHGLAISQHPSFADGIVSVETMLVHESGEWMSSVFSAPVTKNDAQGVGSALTYCRRYSLAAVANIAQDDDDGNAASAPAPKQQVAKPAQTLDPSIVEYLGLAGDMAELQSVWNNIPVGARSLYNDAKEAAKKRISG